MPSPLTIEVLSRLVAFDTTSRNSNLPLIDYAEELLRRHGARTERVHDETGAKTNLWATVGPEDVPGIVLSGHTDCVPVDGQDWTTDPFRLDEREGRYYGRGTCDMKGFLAACLGALPAITSRPLHRPIHFALSYDEEVGCLGVRRLFPLLATRPVLPEACIVGEPSDMEVVIGHKAKRSLRARVRGTAGHSSLAPQFVNAVEHCARLVEKVRGIGLRMKAEGRRDDLYDLPYTTAHVGTFHGGTALNIVPDEAVIEFEFRVLPEEDADALVEEVAAYIRDVIEPEMKAVDAASGIDLEMRASFPGLATAPDAPVAVLARQLAGRNAHSKVAYGTEAGLFAEMGGVPAIICGPGSIAQAHKPDEYVSAIQLDRCEAFLDRLLDYCAAP